MKKNILPLLFACCILFLSSCTKSSYGVSNNTTTNTVSYNGVTSFSLGGTKWALYQYKDANMQSPMSRNDTLVFIDATNYKYNNVPCTYDLRNSYSFSNTMLRLYGTPFGDIGGSVAPNFMTYGEIIDASFSQIVISPGVTYYIWMKKI